MTADEVRLAALWPFVRDNLPAAPGLVLEIGCGPLGGFVPELLAGGYQAIGIDPDAPQGTDYRRVEFERYEDSSDVAGIVACTSLHHVVDLGEVLGKARTMLAPGGVLVVVEWARELFDEATARWCFHRLGPQNGAHGWLHERRAEWQASGGPWEVCCHGWAEHERLHTADDMLRELDARFDCRRLGYGPYFFPDLDGVTEVEEQEAIDAGLIRATCIQFVGTAR